MIARSSAPLLSVVIPTYKRAQFLPRAISSALKAAPDGDVQVIVIPNGPDDSWKIVAESFQEETKVQWHPIQAAQANMARNHGLVLACGKYVRFLDDDDELLIRGTHSQLDALSSNHAEICTGTIEMVSDDGDTVNYLGHNDVNDLFVAMARPGRICLPIAHVFSRECLSNFRWDENRLVEQDTDWMLQLASHRDWKWITVEDRVARWTQHEGPRISSTITQPQRAKITIELLLKHQKNLEDRNALSTARKEAIAEAIWYYVHENFYLEPWFWSKAARSARNLSNNSTPSDSFYRLPIIRNFPIATEWIVLPKRILNYFHRKVSIPPR